MVNVVAIRKVANAIAKAERAHEGLDGVIGFNMQSFVADRNGLTDFVDDCGTVACIAGWACLIDVSKEDVTKLVEPGVNFLEKYNRLTEIIRSTGGDKFGGPFNEAQRKLGLTLDQADELFVPTYKPIDKITAAEAVATLRRLAKTGRVSWGRASVRGKSKTARFQQAD